MYNIIISIGLKKNLSILYLYYIWYVLSESACDISTYIVCHMLIIHVKIIIIIMAGAYELLLWL